MSFLEGKSLVPRVTDLGQTPYKIKSPRLCPYNAVNSELRYSATYPQVHMLGGTQIQT